jgi:hypothetical protein
MLQTIWKRAVRAFAPLIVAAVGVAACAADTVEQNPGVDRLPEDAARMYSFVKSPHPGELRWQQIPWLTDLREGIRQAQAEHRPLMLFVSGDDPLEKC